MKPQEFQRIRQAEGLHKALVHAVTRYDRKNEAQAAKNPRFCHNIYALGRYLLAVDRVTLHVDSRAFNRLALSLDEKQRRENAALRHALEQEFDGALLAELQRVSNEG